MEKEYAIGIDLGGTSARCALIDNDGIFHFRKKLPSNVDVSAEATIGQLIKAANEVKAFAEAKEYTTTGVGIGTPGVVSCTSRIVLGGAGNIQGQENLRLADRMEKETGLPTQLGNDANLIGLGETTYGAENGATHMVFLTIGTGIDGAVITDGELFSRYANRGAELGCVPLIANGEPCAYGSIGCLKHYASIAALVRCFSRRVAEASISYPNGEINGELIVRLYKQGDEIAAESLNEHYDLLGHGIARFISIFSLQRVVIGGELSEVGDFYIQKVSEKAPRYIILDCTVNTGIMAASLGNKVGSIGVTPLLLNRKPN